jgi:predicted RNA-binding protein with RPS1 domain
MKHEHQTFFAEAVILFRKKNFAEARSAFETLLCLLGQERQTKETQHDITCIQQWIQRINNPAAENARVRSQVMAKRAALNEKKNLQQQQAQKNQRRHQKAICKRAANKYFSENNFEEAAQHYLKWIEEYGSKDPVQVADAYWNCGLCYEELAMLAKGQEKEEHLHHAIEMIGYAVRTYPETAASDKAACDDKKQLLEQALEDLLAPASRPTAVSSIPDLFEKAKNEIESLLSTHKTECVGVVERLQKEVQTQRDVLVEPSMTASLFNAAKNQPKLENPENDSTLTKSLPPKKRYFY